MSKKIFIANFPFSMTSEELDELFGGHGEVVSAKVATDRETGRSRGFGFVEMATDGQAATAIQELDGFQVGGRPLTVRAAEDRPNRPQRGPRPNSGGPRRNSMDF